MSEYKIGRAENKFVWDFLVTLMRLRLISSAGYYMNTSTECPTFDYEVE